MPNPRRWLGVTVNTVPHVAMHGGLNPVTGSVIGEETEPGGRKIVIGGGLKHHRFYCGRVGAICPEGHRDRTGATEVDSWHGAVLICSVGRDGIADLAGDPTDSVDQIHGVAVTRGVRRRSPTSFVKLPPADQAR